MHQLHDKRHGCITKLKVNKIDSEIRQKQSKTGGAERLWFMAHFVTEIQLFSALVLLFRLWLAAILRLCISRDSVATVLG